MDLRRILGSTSRKYRRLNDLEANFEDEEEIELFDKVRDSLRKRTRNWRDRTYEELPNEEQEETNLEDIIEDEEINTGVDEAATQEISELTGLLSEVDGIGPSTLGAGAGATGVASGVAGVVSGIVNAVTGAVGGVSGVGTAVGVAVTAGVVDHVRRKGLVLPNSEYIGPGNDIPISAAKNPADQVARDHDLSYAELELCKLLPEDFRKAVEESDLEAIKRFYDVYNEDGSWNALIGHYGLRVKRFIEKLLGFPLYPRRKNNRKYNIRCFLFREENNIRC